MLNLARFPRTSPTTTHHRASTPKGYEHQNKILPRRRWPVTHRPPPARPKATKTLVAPQNLVFSCHSVGGDGLTICINTTQPTASSKISLDTPIPPPPIGAEIATCAKYINANTSMYRIVCTVVGYLAKCCGCNGLASGPCAWLLADCSFPQRLKPALKIVPFAARLETVRENWCRPSGTCPHFSHLPGAYAPG